LPGINKLYFVFARYIPDQSRRQSSEERINVLGVCEQTRGDTPAVPNQSVKTPTCRYRVSTRYLRQTGGKDNLLTAGLNKISDVCCLQVGDAWQDHMVLVFQRTVGNAAEAPEWR
jgi:hypothetical protein